MISAEIVQALFLLFAYNLNITFYSANNTNADVMIFCHGCGGNAADAEIIYKKANLPHHILSFDFPDADMNKENNHRTFGTIQELLPLLALIKICITDLKMQTIHLYGFSAGGGAVINAVALLNTSLYDSELLAIGITSEYKQLMLNAIQKSTIILDCPLKSVEEIISFRGTNAELEMLAQQYKINNLRPIDMLQNLNNLCLSIILYFQRPDDILSNRDDETFYEQLQRAIAPSSKIRLLIADEGGHSSYHSLLWNACNALWLPKNL